MNTKQVTYPLNDRWTYLWLVIGTFLTLFSTGQWTIPLITWFSSIFVLRFMRSQPVLRGYILTWLTNYAIVSVAWWPILGYGSSLPAFLIIMGINTLIIGALPFLVDRLLVSKLPGLPATFVYPLTVTALEFLTLSANPMGTIGGQAYTQYNSMVLMQIVSVTGMWGITFLVAWFAAIANYCWERSFSWQDIKKGVIVYSLVLMVVLAYGNIRLAFPQSQVGTMRIHGFIGMDGKEMKSKLLEAQQISWESYRNLSADMQDQYMEGTIREAKQGAQLILWPENALWLAAEDESAMVSRAEQIARDEGVYLALGYAVEYPDDKPYENKFVIIDPAGQVVLEHLKFGGQAIEGFKAGDGILKTVETPYGVLSGIICWDAFFQKPVLQAGRNGTDILLTNSFEFRAIVPMHAQITTFRSIENGVSLVRVADNGISFATDPYGRTLAWVDFFTASERAMVAQVPTYHVRTLYAIIGDLFGWLAVIGFAVVTIWAVMNSWRLKREQIASPV